MKKISIIVPIFNEEKYITQCIDSILNQTFKEFELILIDDGSTDNSLEIVEEYKTKNPEQIEIITLKNQGVAVARNTGIAQSCAPYIMFVDADDFIEESTLELLYQNATKHDSDLVLCNARVVKEEDGSFIRIWTSGRLNEEVQSIHTNKTLINTIIPASWGKLYKKSLFIDNNIQFPIGLKNQELGTTSRILCHSKTISKVNKALYNYRYKKESAIKTYDHKILDVVKNLLIVKRYYASQGLIDEFYEQLEYLYIKHLLFRGMYKVKYVEDVSLREELMDNILENLNKEFPSWYKNKKISKLPHDKRMYLYLVWKGHMDRVMIVLRLKKRLLRR